MDGGLTSLHLFASFLLTTDWSASPKENDEADVEMQIGRIRTLRSCTQDSRISPQRFGAMLLAVTMLLPERRSSISVKIFSSVTQWRSDGAGCETQEVEMKSNLCWRFIWSLLFLFSPLQLKFNCWLIKTALLPPRPPTATVYIFNLCQNNEMNEYKFVDYTMKYN